MFSHSADARALGRNEALAALMSNAVAAEGGLKGLGFRVRFSLQGQSRVRASHITYVVCRKSHVIEAKEPHYGGKRDLETHLACEHASSNGTNA